ncbi:hypothetical protein SAMN05216266_12016 [Amycolatopsis marina]|uniref:Secreted protein n=1 Tax=Amycolatopsis marina TaxID=490629 RepID=A0A1I1C1S3_9PSEU|nr:hypothetical protein [Amycolatopsis marina]SFB56585.1 hypothetical protein SAMN05216266_12016 [Amycolatopsis marina]
MNTAAHASHSTYQLDAEETQLAEGVPTEFRFRITDPNGTPVTSFDEVHEKKVHLIVVRRDLTGYWHLHPTEGGDGTWSVQLPGLEPGQYRVFADFSASELGHGLTVGTDLTVVGDGVHRALPAPAPTFVIGEYEVDLEGTLLPGQQSRLTFSLRHAGEPVTDLQPHLGSYGHLVAVRADDLAYVHVHPNGSPDDGVTPPGPQIAFHAHVAEAGAYRLFLDFRHDDRVRTAEFTLITN